MIWRGIVSDSTDVDDTPGVSEYQANTRMNIAGELQRRYGFLSSELDQESGPILGLMAGNNFMVSEATSGGTGSLIGHVVPGGIPVGFGIVPPVIAVQGIPCGATAQDWLINEVVPGENVIQPIWFTPIARCPGEITMTFDGAQIATFVDIYNTDTLNTFFDLIATLPVGPGDVITQAIPVNQAACDTGASLMFVFQGPTEVWLLTGNSTLGCQ